MSAQVPVYRVLIIDDNRAIHEDFQKILSFEQEHDLDELESGLFGGNHSRKLVSRFEKESSRAAA